MKPVESNHHSSNFSLADHHAWLKNFDKSLNDLLSDLVWTENDVLQRPQLMKCPHDPHHFICAPQLEGHKNVCRLVKAGVSKEVALAMPDTATQTKSDKTPLPDALERLQATIQERMEKSALEKEQEQETPLSQQELLAAMRDVKRRRQAYRRVHTARKSYTEILHEVIASQMEYLEELNSALMAHHQSQSCQVVSQSTTNQEEDNSKRRSPSPSSSRKRHHHHKTSSSSSRHKKHKKE